MREITTQFKLQTLLLFFLVALSMSPVNAAQLGDTIIDVTLDANREGPNAGQFDTLIAAILAADPSVFETLDGSGQYTVFAPTDDAFAMIDLTSENINSLPQDALTGILFYHVLHGRRYELSVLGASRLNTLLQNESLFQAGGVLTDHLGRTATIIITNVEAANGVIHVIDAVVLPYFPE